LTFTSAQVFDHVAKAVLKALQALTSQPGVERRAGIALPADDRHEREVSKVLPALRTLGVAVFWVSRDRSVTIDSLWEV
jgi:hypothetical protein